MFRGIEHRLEEVLSKDGICYINDSKSTTIASLGWALERMPKKVVLVMGGRHKGGDFSLLKDKMKQRVKFLVLIGESAKQIEKAFEGDVTILKAASLLEAVRHARAAAGSGSTVLFSPACASFDMFQDYQDRGKKFKEIVSSFQNAGLETDSKSSEFVNSSFS